MAIIPRGIYRAVEWHLHNVPRLMHQRDRQERADIVYSQMPGGIPCLGGSGGGHSDKAAKAGIALAEKDSRMDRYRQWQRCIDRTKLHFAGEPEFDMVLRYYGTNRTIEKVAGEMFVNKQTVNRYRDKVVAYLALLAACEGLISMPETEGCHG